MLLSHTSSVTEASNTQADACILRCTSVKAGRQLPSGLDRVAPLLSRSKHMLALNAGKCMWERCKGWSGKPKCEVKYEIKHVAYHVDYLVFTKLLFSVVNSVSVPLQPIFFCREKCHNVAYLHTHPHSFHKHSASSNMTLTYKLEIDAYLDMTSASVLAKHTHAHSVHVCWAKWPAFISLVGKSLAAVRRQRGCRCKSVCVCVCVLKACFWQDRFYKCV